jgi:hypothetical protein
MLNNLSMPNSDGRGISSMNPVLVSRNTHAEWFCGLA